MRKLLFILLISLFLGGCYDYQELNDLAIISGIAIDYEDDYEVTFEVLESQKESNEKASYVKATGKTISEAFANANLKIHKEGYFAHVKVILFSEEIAKNYMQDVTDYILREPNIRKIFYPLIVLDGKASVILENNNEASPVTSVALEKALTNNRSTPKIAITMDFETMMNNFVDPKKDAYLNTIKKDETTTFALSGMALFKDYQMVGQLNEQETFLFNLLKNTSDNTFIKMACPFKEDKTITIDLYHNRDTDIKVKEDNIVINSSLKGSVIEDNCEIDFRTSSSYEELSHSFSEEIKKEIDHLIKKIQNLQSDVLEFQNIYYQKERKELTNWYLKDTLVNIDLDINKNGLIFKVNPNE